MIDIPFLPGSRGRATALVVLALALLVPGQSSLPVTDRDEALYVQASRQMAASGDFIDIRFQDRPRHKKPIGIYWLQAGAATVTGRVEDAWVYRLPSLAAAIASVLLVLAIGRTLWDVRAGEVAALLLLCTVWLGIEARLAKTDAVLLCTVCLAQLALARLFVSRHATLAPRGRDVALFWAAIGAGILVKGPIILLVSGATALSLAAWERSALLLRRLRAWPGVLLTATIVLPWLLAITVRSRGAFFGASVGNDLLGKVLTGQESHGAPPGYYAMLLWLIAWPASLFVAAALPWTWQQRREDAVRFCLAWFVPTWILFELITTKLPHYLLPMLPAALLLAGAALTRRDASPARPGLLTNIPTVLSLGIGLVLALAPVVAPPLLSRQAGAAPAPVDAGTAAAAIAAAVTVMAAFACWRAITRNQPGRALLGAVVATGALSLSVYGTLSYRLPAMWISDRARDAVWRVSPCRNPFVAAAGYAEPSLVFRVGTETRTTDGAGAAQHLLRGAQGADGCALALVSERELASFEGDLASGGHGAARLETIRGFDYTHGKPIQLGIYSLAPAAPVTRGVEAGTLSVGRPGR